MTLPKSNASLRLFALSFVALFLELMVIRWSPSVVRMVAYYANLMLISSFLGLGIGAMLAGRRGIRFQFFPVLVAIEVAVLCAGRWTTMPGSSSESRFYLVDSPWLGYIVLVAIFVANALTFVPLGQRVGELFQTLPPLRAYAWDLGGSLAGTIIFGLFSYTHFSPLIGMAIVSLIFLALSERKQILWSAVVLVGVIGAMSMLNDRNAMWSPYYYVTIHSDIPHSDETLSDPPADIRTMRDPPMYGASVNQDFYQNHGTIDPSRYTPGNPYADRIMQLVAGYSVPYRIAAHHDHVAVMGAGGGTDIEAALLAGAQQVDAVEIDPRLVALSRRFNASDVYDDPRVHLHINDARAFLRNDHDRYDMIVFGYLDSQALFSYMSNLRLDGYIYTVQSLASAWHLLKDDGTMSLSFVVTKKWLAGKLVAMVRQATGREPLIYKRAYQLILIASKAPPANPPEQINSFLRISPEVANSVWPDTTVATDDWPYLYLSHQTIPSDYLIVIGILVAISLIAVFSLRGTSFGLRDGHFLFMGMGFLLLETASIGDCSLYFGTTWLVTTIVICGVLLMVLAANLLAMNFTGFTRWLYLPLIAAILTIYFVPRDQVLGFSTAGRFLWTLLMVPLPIFFAGLIFSSTFRHALNPAALFGANLIGAMLGGFCEYLGMAIGHRALLLIVIGAYLASLACVNGNTAQTRRIDARSDPTA